MTRRAPRSEYAVIAYCDDFVHTHLAVAPSTDRLQVEAAALRWLDLHPDDVLTLVTRPLWRAA